MIKGIYTAASGMMLGMSRQDALANNLANVNTSGYKKDVLVSSAFPGMLISRIENQNGEGTAKKTPIGNLNSGACIGQIFTDLSKGNLKRTENPLDLALGSASYFVLESSDGERFTRNGEFKLGAEGLLCDVSGNPVLDINDEYIYIEDQFTVDKYGNIMASGEYLTTLKIASFEEPGSLRKVGYNLMESNDGYTLDENPEVLQNYVETSNVDAVKEMVELIKATRSYESLQKVIQAEDETLGTAIQQVGRVT